jgi:hypothetical protein
MPSPIQNQIDDNTINLLNVDLNDTDEICMICQDTLSSATKYKLPECGHEYHTHCVVAWFRNGDSRCPYCGNNGVNHNEPKKRRNSTYRYYRFKENACKIMELRKHSKSSDANPLLKKRFAELEVLNKALSVKLEEHAKFKERIKTSLTNYTEVDKERKAWRNKIWTARKAINAKRQAISDMHIVPLIIPMPVDVNF